MWPEDFYIDRLLTREEITHACCTFFGITAEDVAVIQNIYEDTVPPVLVVCEQGPAQGDFAARLCVYPKEALQHTNSTHFVEHTAELHGCRCLMGDSSFNPYRWLLVEGTGQITPVFVDKELDRSLLCLSMQIVSTLMIQQLLFQGLTGQILLYKYCGSAKECKVIPMISIHSETNDDIAAIHQVNVAAFGRTEEADLVDALRAQGQIVLSLVAVQEEQIIGHILFSPVVIQDYGAQFAAVGLGPMAVLPHHQQHGIGSQLVRHGLDLLRADGHEIVVVLGHPRFYPRFGFRAAARFGIRSQFSVPSDLFMVAELVPGALHGRQGTVIYADAFNSVA